MLLASYKYWAFISYCHRDKKWGKWLIESLETYRVPKEMAGKVNRRGDEVPEKLHCYRDLEESPTAADLSQVIQSSLEQSRYLIVVCSPHSARSRWVNEEVRAFKRLGRENCILPIIVAGEPNASDGKPDFPEEAECFAEALRFRAGPDGQLTKERIEPVCADAREGGGGKKNALLKLLSGLLGVDFDALKRREEERRHRNLIGWSIALATVLLLVASLGIFSTVQWREAERQGKLARNLAQSEKEARVDAQKQTTNAVEAQKVAETQRTNAEIQTLRAINALNQARFVQGTMFLEAG